MKWKSSAEGIRTGSLSLTICVCSACLFFWQLQPCAYDLVMRTIPYFDIGFNAVASSFPLMISHLVLGGRSKCLHSQMSSLQCDLGEVTSAVSKAATVRIWIIPMERPWRRRSSEIVTASTGPGLGPAPLGCGTLASTRHGAGPLYS